jgi:hypothetical protein
MEFSISRRPRQLHEADAPEPEIECEEHDQDPAGKKHVVDRSLTRPIADIIVLVDLGLVSPLRDTCTRGLLSVADILGLLGVSIYPRDWVSRHGHEGTNLRLIRSQARRKRPE